MERNPETTAILDVRAAAAFESLHLAEAVNIPLEELPGRIHELPPKTTPIVICDTDRERAESARALLLLRGRIVTDVLHGPDCLRAGPTTSGPTRVRLWRPHTLLQEAVCVAQGLWGSVQGRRALDVACGSGRDAVYLALAGFEVEGWDILPDAIARCEDLAARNGVEVRTRVRDLREPLTAAAEAYDLISCFYYLQRPIMAGLAAAVLPGGLVVYETFADPHPLMFSRPRGRANVLRAGELPTWFSHWQVITSREGLTEPNRFAASLIARSPVGRALPAGEG